MNYEIKILKKARKFIEQQQPAQRERINKAIAGLPNGDVRSLQGNEGVYRLRVGDYRIIYELNNNILLITVVDAGNRGQIYNKY